MDYNNKPDGYYNNSREEMLDFLPNNAKKILDVGCGNGLFAQLVKKRNKAEVWGIEYMEQEALKAQDIMYKTFIGPCEDHIDSLPDDYFDVIYFNDVLEHLIDPYLVLDKIKCKLSSDGVIISSIPNIRYHNVFIKLLFKKEFEYQSYGVLDKTHLRFFTKKSIKNMYINLGYDVITHVGINGSRSLKPILYNIPLFFTAMDMRYPQYATVARLKK